MSGDVKTDSRQSIKVLLVAYLIVFVGNGLPVSCQGIVLPAISAEMGFSTGSVSPTVTIKAWSGSYSTVYIAIAGALAVVVGRSMVASTGKIKKALAEISAGLCKKAIKEGWHYNHVQGIGKSVYRVWRLRFRVPEQGDLR